MSIAVPAPPVMGRFGRIVFWFSTTCTVGVAVPAVFTVTLMGSASNTYPAGASISATQ